MSNTRIKHHNIFEVPPSLEAEQPKVILTDEASRIAEGALDKLTNDSQPCFDAYSKLAARLDDPESLEQFYLSVAQAIAYHSMTGKEFDLLQPILVIGTQQQTEATSLGHIGKSRSRGVVPGFISMYRNTEQESAHPDLYRDYRLEMNLGQLAWSMRSEEAHEIDSRESSGISSYSGINMLSVDVARWSKQGDETIIICRKALASHIAVGREAVEKLLPIAAVEFEEVYVKNFPQ